jgi:ABC-2 type transport system ATP-binding protein
MDDREHPELDRTTGDPARPSAVSRTETTPDSVLRRDAVEAVIAVEHVSKRYGSRTVVDDVSFTVRRGEIMGMVGPNGAGKTTTLRMLVGLIRPTGGRIRLHGHLIDGERALALRGVGAIMEESRFYPYLTGLENLRQIARMRSMRATTDALMTVLGTVGLQDAAGRVVRHYSLGMRQRLALAAALMAAPSVLVLDEPMNGLDPAGIKDVRDRLRALAHTGVAMVLSSHLLAEMEQLADRVILMDHGRILGEDRVGDDQSGRPVPVLVTVGDPERAAAVLTESGIAYEALGQGFQVTLEQTAVPDLVKRLVLAEVPVLSVVPGRPSLEARYLERTGHGGEEVS